MDTKRSASVRTKLGAALMVVGLLSGLFAVLGQRGSGVGRPRWDRHRLRG